MNNVQLSGRITKDIELRIGDNGNASAKFSIAVDRTVKRNDEWVHEADFINCVAFGKTSEFCEKWFKKGSFIIVNGNIKTGSYTNKDGVKVYTTDVFVEKAEFGGEKKSDSENAGSNARSQQASGSDSFMQIPDSLESELPFL
jgi:single-strand DNA-binding protein